MKGNDSNDIRDSSQQQPLLLQEPQQQHSQQLQQYNNVTERRRPRASLRKQDAISNDDQTFMSDESTIDSTGPTKNINSTHSFTYDSLQSSTLGNETSTTTNTLQISVELNATSATTYKLAETIDIQSRNDIQCSNTDVDCSNVLDSCNMPKILTTSDSPSQSRTPGREPNLIERQSSQDEARPMTTNFSNSHIRDWRLAVNSSDGNLSLGRSLNLPTQSANRKFSLQPAGLQNNRAQSNNSSNNNNASNIAVSNQSQQHLKIHNDSVPNSFLTPRKSVIGRLERPSFQAQRLSDVGIAFGQQITAKIGLKLPASQERIVEQTRWLYLRYIITKLRQNKLPLRDLNLTKSSRARRAALLGECSPTFSSVNTTPVISYSAPIVTANPLNTSNSRGMRKRSTLVTDSNSRDLSMFVTQMRLRKPSQQLQQQQTTVAASSYDAQTLSPTTQTLARKHVMDPTINKQVFGVIVNFIRELRMLKPEYYGDTIYEVIGIDKFTSLDSLLESQQTICQEMTRSEITWCRITALFSIFGAMSLDCVRLGAPEHVGPLLDGFIEFVERDLALWISQQGGWESFLYKYRATHRFSSIMYTSIAVAIPVLFWLIINATKGYD